MSAKPKAESKAKQPLHSLSIEVRKDEDPATKVAQTLLQPAVQAAMIVWGYGQDNLDVDAVVSELTNQAQAANGGDLSRAEAMLIAQAHALDAIFARLAVLAAPRAGRSLEACETYLRLALKAQSQCRATLETLGALKNPSPALFVTLFKFHRALVDRKYHPLFSSSSHRPKPGPKGPSTELIAAIVEMKRRNLRFGCVRIAQQISHAFGIGTDKDVVRRVLAKHFRPAPGANGPSWRPSWLTFIGHLKDSLWSADLFRVESILLRSH